MAQGDDRVKKVLLLESLVENARKKKGQLKLEYLELQKQISRVLDPELGEKIKLNLIYLNEMIRSEYIQIQALNDKINKFERLDFGQREVDGERNLVQIEDELNRIKMRIDSINIANQQSHKHITLSKSKQEKVLEEKARLQEQLTELERNYKNRDFQPQIK